MSKIGFYVGSFDPFHVGHLEVAQMALRYVDKVIIVPNNPNRKKIYRTTLDHRINMIQLSIKDEPKMEISREDVNSLNQHLYENNYLVGLIGSDQCNKEPKSKVHEWLITPRIGYNLPILSWSVPTTHLSSDLFHHQQWSSTYIRHQIENNPPRSMNQISLNIFKDSIILKKTQVINDSVLSYIKEHSLYTVASRVEKMYPNRPIHKVKDNVIIVDHDVVIKYYDNYELFKYEKLAFDIAQSLKLPIPQYLFDHDNCMIGMSYCGKSIKDAVGEGYSGYDAGYKVGVLLKRLHTIEVTSNPNSILNNRKIKNMIESNILHDIHNYIEEYSKNPGHFTYWHGDASINNFTILNDSAIMIDFGGLAKMGSFGIPAYEYYQFICSTNFLLFNGKDIKSGFIDGYAETGFTPEADLLFLTYWNRMFIISNVDLSSKTYN